MYDVQIIYCSKIWGSVVTLASGLSPVLDLTPRVLLGYSDLPLQISNPCTKKMSIKINPSKKDPHNQTKGSISWKDFVSQQYAKIHSSGSTSQRSLLRSVVKSYFPLLGQISHRCNLLGRPDCSHKQASKNDPKNRQWCVVLLAGKVQEKTANFSGSSISGEKSIVCNGIFERNYLFCTKFPVCRIGSLRNKHKYPKKNSSNLTWLLNECCPLFVQYRWDWE